MTDPYSAYGNTRAFLDYRIMGFRECTAEVARYMTSVEGVDMKDPHHIRLLNHLENFLAQRELAINAAVAANAQIVMSNVSQATHVPTIVTVPTVSSAQYGPLTPPRASPDNLSPPGKSPANEPLPRFSVAFPATPVLSFTSTPVGIQSLMSQQKSNSAVSTASVGVIKPSVLHVSSKVAGLAPLNVLTSATKPKTISTITNAPTSPTKQITANKTPFRPWADVADN